MKWLLPVFSPPTGTYGGLTRVLAMAAAAQQAGHEVRFCAAGEQAEILRQHGYPVHQTPESAFLGLPEPLSGFVSRLSQRVTPPVRSGRAIGNIWMVLMGTGYARGGYLRRCVDRIMAVIDDYQPDVLFTDLDPAAFLAAHLTGLPIAVPFQGIVLAGQTHGFAWRRMKKAMEAALAAYDITAPSDPETLAFGPQVLKVIPSIPELDGTDPERPDVRYAGQMLSPIKPVGQSGFRPEPGRRYVFVYVGTGSVSLGMLERVLPQVFPAGSERTCIVASQGIKTVRRQGAVEFWPYVDAESLLPHCDWTLCHGGQNTIAQSLRHGVPLIVFPGPIFERRFNAERVRDCGAGLMGEREHFTPEWLSAALARRDEFAAPAAALGARIESYGGAAKAVSMITNWVSGRE